MHQLIERPSLSPAPTGPGWGNVYVIFTTADETVGAIRVARTLARPMESGVTVVHFRPIDFGMPLEEPSGLSPVQTEEFKARLEAVAPDTRVRVCVCRDARQAIPSVLPPHSLIVIGGRHGWWPTRSDRWRRTLEALGYVVVFVGD
jgi:hypothetical protein